MSTRSRSISGVVVVLVVLAGGGIYWFLKDDSPAKVDLNTAAQGITSTTATGSSTTSAGSDASTGIDGTWKVDTTTGKFDFESATGTFVGFRIQENLASIGSTTAVGRTNAVTGSMVVEGTKVTSAELTVDLTRITTNDDRRNQRVQQALQTSSFPQATFKLTEPIELGADAASGARVNVTAKGDLTIHGGTKPVQIPMQAKLVDGTVVVVGSTDVTFSDYGVQVPSAPVVLSVDDHGTLELQMLFTKS